MAATLMAGCSLLYDLDSAQCHQSSDCAVFGSEAPTCVAGICQLSSQFGAAGHLGEPTASGGVGTGGGSGDGGMGLAAAGGTSSAGNSGQGGNAAVSLALVSSLPAPGAVDIDPATHLELVFDAEISPGIGELALIRRSDDHIVETIAIPDPRVTFSGSALLADFDSILGGDTDYYVQLDATAVASASAVFAGIDDADTLPFRTASVAYPGAVSIGLKLWLDADHAPSLKTALGAVSTWGDRSGAGGAVRQLDADAQPQLAEAALNAKNTVSFAGSAYLAAENALAGDSWDAFLVWRSPVAPENDRESLLLLNGPELRVRYGDVSPSTRRSITRTVGADTNTLDFGDPAVDVAHLWSFTFDAGSLRLLTRTDGSGPASLAGLSVRTGSPSGQFSLGGNANGAGLLVGEIAEVIVYDRVLSDTERQGVSSYLEAKWALGFASCGDGEVLGPNRLCYAFEQTPRSWSSARTYCQARGSGWNLADMTNSLENRFVATLLGGNDAWIGGQDDQPLPERFEWVSGLEFWNGSATGSPLNGSYANWNSGEPNGGGDQADCVRMLDSAYWADYSCTGQFGYVCKGPSSP